MPPFLLGVALVFWGWQSGNPLAGIALGIVLEAPRYVKLRLDLGTVEHSRIADLSTIGFVTLAALLGANRGVSRGMLEAFIWAPVALAPVMLAQMLSENGRIPLSALFRYMRKLKRRNPEIKDPLIDVSAVYVVLAMISAGMANARGPAYYAGVVLISAWALYAVRPRHASPAAWVLMLALGAGAGYAGQLAIADMQAQLEAWMVDFYLPDSDTDPYRSVTAIGTIGRLKQYDAIVLRVYDTRGDAATPHFRLLHRASYNTYAGSTWIAREAQMEPMDADIGGTTWSLAAPAPESTWRLRIAARIDGGKALLAMPAATTRISGLSAAAVRRNTLGAVHADVGADWIQYETEGGADISAYSPPSAADSILPSSERAVFERTAAELGLRDVPPAEALRRIESHLGSFAYSLYREHPVPKGETALGDFMTRTRSGHCEYFAAAAALLLRAAGIPSRYATGYAVMERSTLENAYVVRSRHSHAWTRAWVDGRWTDLDTTPPDWFGKEAREAPFWQGLADLARWAGFRWIMREEFTMGDAWYGVLVVLALILGWRMFGGRRITRTGEAGAALARQRYPGEDSEFYSVEKALAPRTPGETHAAWLDRVTAGLSSRQLQQLRDALRLHQRYRFDPAGLAATERNQLREL
ncbi:MAG: transglutaminase domain-containing protein, partial [Betaproteobacteria bacterium]